MHSKTPLVENAWLKLDPAEDTDATPVKGWTLPQILGSSGYYRIAIGPQQGRKAFMICTVRPLDRPDSGLERVAKANGFSLHDGVCWRPITAGESGADPRQDPGSSSRERTRPPYPIAPVATLPCSPWAITAFRRTRIHSPESARTLLKNVWHGRLHAIAQKWTDMHCATSHIGRHSMRQTD
jgi:hypothetical protein